MPIRHADVAATAAAASHFRLIFRDTLKLRRVY